MGRKAGEKLKRNHVEEPDSEEKPGGGWRGGTLSLVEPIMVGTGRSIGVSLAA